MQYGRLITASEAFARPANITAYTAGDVVGPASLTITAASNATPIVITSTAHGLSTGDFGTIASVGGNTNANADWVVTRIDANTFSLATAAGVASVGNSNYTSGGTFTRLLRLANLGPSSKGAVSGKIVNTRLICNSATVTSGTFRVHYFNVPQTTIADNAPYTLLYANRVGRLGYSGALTLVTEGSGSDAAMAQDVTTTIPFRTTAGSQNLFAVITAEAAYTPTSGETFYLEVTVDQY